MLYLLNYFPLKKIKIAYMKHINELQNRFILLTFCWVSTFTITYFYKEIFFFEILKINSSKTSIEFNYFIFTNITELFSTYLKLSYFISNQIIFFYVLINLICFIAPGLYINEYKFLIFFTKLVFIFWIFSFSFWYCFFAPLMWKFFVDFQKVITKQFLNVHFEAKITEYLEFYMKLSYHCNVQFQIIACLILFFSYFNKNKRFIKNHRKTWYLLFLLLGTIITPPEIINQIIVFCTLILFFEAVMFVHLLLNK